MPLGRNVAVVGTVRKVNRKKDWYGDIKYTMNVYGRGWQVWGVVPFDQAWRIKVGDRVRFTANVRRSNGEASDTFGYFGHIKDLQILTDEDY